MGFKKFSLFIAIRTCLLMLTLMAVAYVTSIPGYYAATLLLLLLLIYQSVEILRYVSRTNAELVRFFDAARYADFSQRFESKKLGSGFDELGQAFSDILKNTQDVRRNQEQELKHMKAMVEHVPVPLLSLHQNQNITLWNNSARRLFGSISVTKLTDLRVFGEDFVDKFSSMQPGQSKLVEIEIDGMQHQLALAATQLVTSGKQEMLISMQDIQSELDFAQLSAWQDLVRVLTHEIMNSITPVASLAKTAVDLVDDVQKQINDDALLTELEDVSDAVTTVARRSDSLMQFVSSYRQLTRLPAPKKQSINVSTFLTQVTQVATANWQNKKIALTINVTPESLTLNADKDMLEQSLINLILNAEQALTAQHNQDAKISLFGYLNKRGRVVIDVTDNGPGVPDDIKTKVFVPFYTTKREGSGVGLALTRQIMIAHGGSVKLNSDKIKGTIISLTF